MCETELARALFKSFTEVGVAFSGEGSGGEVVTLVDGMACALVFHFTSFFFFRLLLHSVFIRSYLEHGIHPKLSGRS